MAKQVITARAPARVEMAYLEEEYEVLDELEERLTQHLLELKRDEARIRSMLTAAPQGEEEQKKALQDAVEKVDDEAMPEGEILRGTDDQDAMPDLPAIKDEDTDEDDFMM